MVVKRSGVGYAIANMHRDVADDAVGGSEHAVVLQLHLLLRDLRFQRLHVGSGGVIVSSRLVEVLLADHA